MAMDLPGIHSDRLCRDAEPHVLGKNGMFLLITIRALRPPHYRPRREGPYGKGKKEPRILSADGCDVQKDSAYTSIRGAIPKPADQNDRTSRSRSSVTFPEEAGSRDRDDRRKVERNKNAVRKRSRVLELILKRGRIPGLVCGMYRNTTEEHRHVSEVRALRRRSVETGHRGGKGFACQAEFLYKPHKECWRSDANVFVYVRVCVHMSHRHGEEI